MQNEGGPPSWAGQYLVTLAIAAERVLSCNWWSLNSVIFRLGVEGPGLWFRALTNFLVSMKDWEGSFHSLTIEQERTTKVQ